MSENFVNRVNDFITLNRIDAQILNYKSILESYLVKKLKIDQREIFLKSTNQKKLKNLKFFKKKKFIIPQMEFSLFRFRFQKKILNM